MGRAQLAGEPAPVTAQIAAHRSWLSSPLPVRLLVALVLVLLGLGVPIGVAAHKAADGLAILGLLAAVLGLLIARRQPGNRIALLPLAFAAVIVFYEDAAMYAVADYHFHGGRLPLGRLAVLIASQLWSAIFLMLPLVVLFFPDGRLPPRWRSRGRIWRSAR